MTASLPPTIKYLKNYLPSAFLIDCIDLTFDIDSEETLIKSRMVVQRNPTQAAESNLQLEGSAELINIVLDGVTLQPSYYTLEDALLTVFAVPESFILEIETRVAPQHNSSLMGLYASGGNLFTQCEPEGFRKITYTLDRPDVMSKFSCTIIADKARYPILLSNGNRVGEGMLDKRRHWVKWVDPFRKPTYLFALVAARLAVLRDTFITQSGREITLEIYVDANDIDKSQHAMRSLKRAMAWDEQRFNLEYDLDSYMIVAVSDFNMGAMENKGLNIFNTKYVLAKQETATDEDFVAVEAVIGHEYFHNWSGNRVTCRDWFQLSLKEGLTVFRDQEFTADMTNPAVKRIHDVRQLRALQFPEDAGPTAHPIRPDSYMEMNNFYTMTVYEKGAEVVRMVQTLLGRGGFARGLALYFKRHDGQAVTCDDFIAAMADANDADLRQFSQWYNQVGTPIVEVQTYYNAEDRSYRMTVRQSCAATPGASEKAPLHIPFAVGLLDDHGMDIPLQLLGEAEASAGTRVLSLREVEQTFTFINVAVEPVPSLLSEFSAPVRLNYPYSDHALAFLLAHDSDAFNRWEAGQKLAERTLLATYQAMKDGHAAAEPTALIEAYAQVLNDHTADPELVALALTLPGDAELVEALPDVDPTRLHAAFVMVRMALARGLRAEWLRVFDSMQSGRFRHEDAGTRALKNLCLSYLTVLSDPFAIEQALRQAREADNMTDQMGALLALRDVYDAQREAVYAEFAERWMGDALVMDKWLALHASSRLPATLSTVEALLQHPVFSLKNPNKARALLGAFGRNLLHFHQIDGSGYRFLADQILAIDVLNPQVAARLVGAFNRMEQFESGRRALMRTELMRIHSLPGLSRDVYEIVSKILQV